VNLTFKAKPREGRGWPSYILWGRLRTSTAALLIAFFGIWWLYETYQPPGQAPEAPATQVVPPGFIPDPSYTWVPRTDVRRRATTTTTTPETTTETTSPTSPTEPTSPEATPTPPTSPTTTPAPAPGAPPTPPSPTATPSPSAPPAPGQGPMVTPGLPS
jgi:hypothetical protein